jgi:flagellar protein FliO/FliZ
LIFWRTGIQLLRLFLFFLPTLSLASENNSAIISSTSYIQATIALGVIVALLVGAAWLVKKLSGGREFGQGGVKIVGGVVLGPRERVVLLEVGQERLVIGIVPGQIRTLHRLAVPDQSSESTKESMPERPFKYWLKNFTEQRKND